MLSGSTVYVDQRACRELPAIAEGVLMSRRLVNITLDNLDDLPRRCRKCVFWELDPVAGTRASETGDTELEKEAWVSGVLLVTAEVLPDFGGGGLARMLIQGVAKDLTRRGVKAVEAFGDSQWAGLGHCV